MQLTDVIKNGSFAMSQAVTADNMISYAAPDFPQPAEDQPEEKKSRFSIDEVPNDRSVQTMVISIIKWTPTSVAQTYADGRRVTYQKLAAKWSSGRVSLANVLPLRLINLYERVRLIAKTMPAKYVNNQETEVYVVDNPENPICLHARTFGEDHRRYDSRKYRLSVDA